MKFLALFALSVRVTSCGFDPDGVDLEGEWQAVISGIPFVAHDRRQREHANGIRVAASLRAGHGLPPNTIITVDWRGETLHLERDGKTVTIMMAGEPFATAQLRTDDVMSGTIADGVFIAGGADFRATR